MSEKFIELKLFKKLREYFVYTKKVSYGDKGIYHYIMALDAISAQFEGQRCDIHAKVTVVNVYNDLVEVKVDEIIVNAIYSPDVKNFVTASFPKYLRPKDISWIVKS